MTNFSEVLDKLDAVTENLDKTVININAGVPAESVMGMTDTMETLINIIEEKGIKVTDVVLSARGDESTISFTCEVNPLLPISKDIRQELMQDIFVETGIKIKILK